MKPNVCQCPIGWTGDQCQDDINECVSNKPCDQTCFNTPGSFLCSCRHGFQLQDDRQSCKSIGEELVIADSIFILMLFFVDSNQVALEVSELNSEDIDLDEIDHRLRKLEKAEHHHHQANKNTEKLMYRVDQLEQQQHSTAEALKVVEAHARKTDQLIEHLFKCLRYPHYC